MMSTENDTTTFQFHSPQTGSYLLDIFAAVYPTFEQVNLKSTAYSDLKNKTSLTMPTNPTVPEGGADQVRQHLQVQAQLPEGREGERAERIFD